jgi:hypothetical protein
MSIRDVEFIFVSTICRFDFEFTRQYGIFSLFVFPKLTIAYMLYFSNTMCTILHLNDGFFKIITACSSLWQRFSTSYMRVDILLTFKQLRDCIISLIWFALRTSFTSSLNWFACAKLREWMVMYICVVEISILLLLLRILELF